ncbi:MAG: PilZ domain-containing protein [Magnetovibrionaceae bacterium]
MTYLKALKGDRLGLYDLSSPGIGSPGISGQDFSRTSALHQDRGYHRKNQRVTSPQLRLIVDGEIYLSVDWGLGGFSFQVQSRPHQTPRFKAGQEVLLWSVGTDGYSDLRINARAEVMRVDAESGLIGCRFQGLSSAAFSTLESLMLNRMHRLAQSGLVA